MANLKRQEVGPREAAVCFLGQSGFIYKFGDGQYAVIDPYLSNLCEEKIGLKFKRLMPALVGPDELDRLELAAYLLTHHHEDHLDAPTIRGLQDRRYPFYAPPASIAMLRELGVEEERCVPLRQGSVYRSEEGKGWTIRGEFADHGEYAPDAVGITVEANGLSIFHMGDTALNAGELAAIRERGEIDLLLAPINGRYGNMNETDAAAAVAILQPRYVAPGHFWMLPGNSGGDIEAFIDSVQAASPSSEVLLFAQGETFVLSAAASGAET